MTWFVKATRTVSSTISSMTGTENAASSISFRPAYYKVPKNIRDNCSHFCVFNFLPRENKGIADELGVDQTSEIDATSTASLTANPLGHHKARKVHKARKAHKVCKASKVSKEKRESVSNWILITISILTIKRY